MRMKNKLKNYLKLGMLLFGVPMLITNCHKDDTTEPIALEKQSFSYKITSLDKLTKLKPIINNVKQVKPKTSEFGRDFSNFLPLENLDTDHVIEYTDSTGYSTYTFKIVNEDETSINFENLHLLETDEGYIGYILSWEPDQDWYDSHSTVTPNGDVVLDLSNFQGDITKYSFERDIIWSAKQENTNRSTISRDGYPVEECTFTVVPMCDHMYLHVRGENCTGNLSYGTIETCQTVWIGGNGGFPDYGDSGSGSYDASNPCNNVSGTSIINEEPLSGVDTGCAPNDTTGVFPIITETVCTLGANILPNLFNCLNISAFDQPDITNWLYNTDNACQVGAMTSYLMQNGCSEEAQGFIETILTASSNNSLITTFPFVKYPNGLAEEYTENYPNFTNFLKKEILEIKNDQEVIDALTQVGVLERDEIIEALTWGKGPEIRISPLSSTNVMLGKYNPTPLGEDSASFGPNVIEINSYLVDLLEADLNSINPLYDIKAIKFFIAIVILHEITHYADFHYEGNAYFEEGVETGNLFEDNLFHNFTVYGEQVTLTIDNFTSIVQQYFLIKD